MSNPYDPPTFDGVLPRPTVMPSAANPPSFEGVLPPGTPEIQDEPGDPDLPPATAGLPGERPGRSNRRPPPIIRARNPVVRLQARPSTPAASTPARPRRAPGLFEQLTAAHRRRLSDLGRSVLFSPGERLLRQGQTADAVWVIQDGRVGVHGDGQTATLGPGAVLGEAALFDDVEWAATAEALDHVSALQLPLADLWARTSQPAVIALARSITVRLAFELVARRPPLLPGAVTEPVGAALLQPPTPAVRALLAGPEGLVGASAAELTVLLNDAREHHFTSRGAVPLGNRVFLVLSGAVELGPPGSERVSVGHGSWVGLVDRLAEAPAEVAIVRAGSKLLEVPGFVFDSFWAGRDRASAALVRTVGRTLTARLRHAENRRDRPASDAPPVSAGVPETLAATAVSQKGARGLPAPPALLNLP